jgi:hypothetical protein
MIRLLLVLQGLLRVMETLTDVGYGVKLVESGVYGMTKVLRHMLAAEPGAGVLTASCCRAPLARYGLTRDAENWQLDDDWDYGDPGLFLAMNATLYKFESLLEW